MTEATKENVLTALAATADSHTIIVKREMLVASACNSLDLPNEPLRRNSIRRSIKVCDISIMFELSDIFHSIVHQFLAMQLIFQSVLHYQSLSVVLRLCYSETKSLLVGTKQQVDQITC